MPLSRYSFTVLCQEILETWQKRFLAEDAAADRSEAAAAADHGDSKSKASSCLQSDACIDLLVALEELVWQNSRGEEFRNEVARVCRSWKDRHRGESLPDNAGVVLLLKSLSDLLRAAVSSDGGKVQRGRRACSNLLNALKKLFSDGRQRPGGSLANEISHVCRTWQTGECMSATSESAVLVTDMADVLQAEALREASNTLAAMSYGTEEILSEHGAVCLVLAVEVPSPTPRSPSCSLSSLSWERKEPHGQQQQGQKHLQVLHVSLEGISSEGQGHVSVPSSLAANSAWACDVPVKAQAFHLQGGLLWILSSGLLEAWSVQANPHLLRQWTTDLPRGFQPTALCRLFDCGEQGEPKLLVAGHSSLGPGLLQLAPPAHANAANGRIRETRNEESERDRKFKQKVLEGIMAELRREVDRLDEDAWMFKKLDF
ncbi:hypothetical protein AK812_SmicGene31291 [Symbiodinium microadriaticum]|uniref:Uncharacterized protein n=1 Tax=Symbiodinium microadriaticum TaxID=2951 RepID=A0A1Q9CX20_SYMMI|nr:hypothetical protein AK812_SmicGene31291 [Symbiodinium microadriaticum]